MHIHFTCSKVHMFPSTKQYLSSSPMSNMSTKSEHLTGCIHLFANHLCFVLHKLRKNDESGALSFGGPRGGAMVK